MTIRGVTRHTLYMASDAWYKLMATADCRESVDCLRSSMKRFAVKLSRPRVLLSQH